MNQQEKRAAAIVGRRIKCTRPGCFTPLHQILIDAGIRTHPTCEPDYPIEAHGEAPHDS